MVRTREELQGIKRVYVLETIGKAAIKALNQIGHISGFINQTVVHSLRGRFYFSHFLRQCELLGFNSLPIVLLTSFFTGGVLALQTYNGFNNEAIASSQLGSVVALSMLRELGPVLASLMVAGRVGAAMAAEIGTMRVTEQIDALVTLATHPIRYLVVPRVVACLAMMPLLVVVANCVGIYGGSLVATDILGLNSHLFFNSAFGAINADDIILSLVKSIVFGFIIGVMGCYHGYYSKGGAEGVGKATTVAVVYASVAILVSDYFITAMMM